MVRSSRHAPFNGTRSAAEAQVIMQDVQLDLSYIISKVMRSVPKLIRLLFLGSVFVGIVGYLSPVLALNPQKRIDQYGHNVWFRHNGLPANAINAVVQAYDGYIWLGTPGGLFRFDGVSFTPVSTNPQDSRNSETVSCLCVSRDSSLWVGTAYGGLRQIKDGKVIVYGPSQGFYETQVTALCESRMHHLWIGTSYGLYMYSNGKFESIPIYTRYVTGIAEDSCGRIWVGTGTGVRVFDDVRAKQIDSITTSDGLPNDFTTRLYADRQSNVWIGTDDGLARWRNGVITAYSGTDGLTNNHITAICEDRDNNMWFGSYGGISRLSDGRWESMTASDGLTNDYVLSITEDHEGSLWVGTLEGLNQFMDVSVTTYTTRDGLSNDHVTNIVETVPGTLYFLSDVDASVTRLRNGKYTKFSANAGPVYVDRDKSLWIGQSKLLIHITGDRVRRYDDKDGIPSTWISAITEDDESLILFLDGIGIRRFVNGKLEPYLMKDGKQYASTEYVVCFYYQPGGTLWIGTTHGLVRIRKGVDTVFGPKDGMAGDWNNSICDDGRGSLWISSPRDGLTRYSNGKFTVYNAKAGLFTNEIYCVVADNHGDLWLSSPKGIGHIKRQELDDYAAGRISTFHTEVFSTPDGMKTDECFGEWQPAGWKTHEGHIWFATQRGAVMINPDSLVRNTLPPPVYVEKMVADGKTVSFNHAIKLPPGTKNVEIHFTALSFLVPSRVHFRYKLAGFDKDWVDADTRRVAYYTNLPPGSYRFLVKACNNDGVWNEKGASLDFGLMPFFYQTYWFYGLMVAIAGGIAFGLYRLRIWQLLKKEKDLNERIQEAMANIKTLGGLIPICSNCKKIRDDRGYWEHLEKYIQTHSEAHFSHGICPECAAKLYPDFISGKGEEGNEGAEP